MGDMLDEVLEDHQRQLELRKLSTKHVIYTVHLPNGKHLMTQERLNQFLHSDKAMQYQDCQIKITVERVK